MGIIDKLKGFLTGVAESRGRTDPVFGDIVFEDDFWSGSASFAPVALSLFYLIILIFGLKLAD